MNPHESSLEFCFRRISHIVFDELLNCVLNGFLLLFFLLQLRSHHFSRDWVKVSSALLNNSPISNLILTEKAYLQYWIALVSALTFLWIVLLSLLFRVILTALAMFHSLLLFTNEVTLSLSKMPFFTALFLWIFYELSEDFPFSSPFSSFWYALVLSLPPYFDPLRVSLNSCSSEAALQTCVFLPAGSSSHHLLWGSIPTMW